MTWRRVVLTALWQWDVLLREHVYPTVSRTALQSGVGLDRGLGEQREVSIVSIAVVWLLLGSLSVYDVLFMLVSMVGDWLLLVAWLGNVVLLKLVVWSVAVGWQLWMALVFGGVLFKLELVVLSLMSAIRLCKLGRRLVVG